MANTVSALITGILGDTAYQVQAGQAGVREKIIHGTVAVTGLADNEVVGLAWLPGNAQITEFRAGGDVNVDMNLGLYATDRASATTNGTAIASAEDTIVDGKTLNATSFADRAEWTGTNAVARGSTLYEAAGRTTMDPDNPQYEVALTVEDAAVADGTGTIEFVLKYVDH